MADFFNCDKDEVVFGQNMTTITFALSRAIGRELKPGDEIVLTTLDHDANVAPWRALEEKGVVIRQVDIREEDCTLDLEDLKQQAQREDEACGRGLRFECRGHDQSRRRNHQAGARRRARWCSSTRCITRRTD